MDVQDVGQPPSYTRRWKDGRRTLRWRPSSGPVDPPPLPPPAAEPVEPEPVFELADPEPEATVAADPATTDVLPVAGPPPIAPPHAAPHPGRGRSALAAAALVLAAAGGIGVGAAIGASHHPDDAQAAPVPSASQSNPAARGTAGAGRLAALRTRATITAQSGSTWTVRTDDGRTLTVTITPSTTWGTRMRAVTRAQFHVGSPLVVFGRVVGGTVTAARIVLPPG